MKDENIESMMELSPLQQGMLFHTLYAPGSGVYVVQWTVRLEGRIEVGLFQRAWQYVVDRHAALRTSFHWEELEKPVQVVYRRIPLTLDHRSWRRLSQAEQQDRLAQYLRTDRERGFDLEMAPLMRLAIFELGEDRWHLVWSFHHLYLDGWSNNLVLSELFQCYEAFSEGREIRLAPARPYEHYVAWLGEQDLGQAERFWRTLLAGFTASVPLARWQDLLPDESDGYEELELTVAAATSSALRALAQQRRLTLNTLAQGAWGLLLSRYTGEQDVVFGNTTSGRPADLPGVESMVGLFINTLPVRVKVEPQESALPWLERFQDLLADLRQYEYTPLDRIRGWSEMPAGNALFDNILVFENYPWNVARERNSQVLEVKGLHTVERTNYPMTVAVTPGPPLTVKLLYDRRYFDDTAARRMGRHYEHLLRGLAADPARRRLGEVPMLAAAERQQLVVEWNDVTSSYPRDVTLHALFEAQAEHTPEAVAVVFDRHLSYRELNRQANRLADHLGSLGVGREQLIAIYLERSPETVVAILAVAKAGGAYLPLDLASPPERLAFMLEDAGAPVLITSARLAATLPAELAEARIKVVCLDRDAAAVARRGAHNPQPPAAGANHLAYVIYTSGSTGRPKGIGIPHRAVLRLVVNTDYVVLGPDDRVAQASTTSFDAATFELWGALLHGARLVGIPKEVAIAPPALAAALRKHKITTLFLTTALYNQMAQEDPEAFIGLRHLLFGGEAVDPGWVREVLGRFPGRLIHVYGPTESTTFTTWQRVREVPARARTVAIGAPIANTEVYVVDRGLAPVPVGVAGELWAGGDGLARGYFGRPRLSAEKFVPHPFAARPGERLYRTGDLVRTRPEGAIEFLGRIDHQVKLRGFRVELGEIEAVLNRHGDVRDSVVVMRDQARLVAYVVTAGEPRPAVRDLRECLRQALPDYMVPASFVFLDALPLTPSGKVDRRALPAPVAGEISPQGELAGPGNPTEDLLAGIFEEVLGVGGLGAHDDFFELGGHSLMATQLASRVRETFAVDLPLRKIFESPTLAELAAIIDAAQLEQRGLQMPPMVPVVREQEIPLSFAQQRMWILYQLEPGTPAYNVAAAERLSGAVDAGIIERIFNEVVRRHEALRTTFTIAGGRPVQVIAEHLRLPLPVADLDRLAAPRREGEARRLAGEEARRLFDLTVGPLVRVTLLRLAEKDHVLLVTMHHIVSDGWSMGIFVRELSMLFEAYSRGNPSPLAELPLQYADFALWQRRWLAGEVLEAEMAYWRAQLAGAPRHLDLPTDRPRPAAVTFRGRTREIAIPKELSQALAARGRAGDATLFMTLLAAFAVLLSRYSGQEDVVVGSPIAGRNRRETEGLIGFFVNTLVLRTQLGGNPSFERLLAGVRRMARDAYAHQNVPFEQLVDEIQPQRDTSLHPLFQVMFVLQNAPQGAWGSSQLTLTPLRAERFTATFDLTLSLEESASGLVGSIQYSTDLFDAVTIDRMAGHLRTLIAGIAARGDERVSDYPLLPAAQQHQLRSEWNDTRDAPREPLSLCQRIERWAERAPDAPAVVFGERWLSYRELDRRANQLAHALRARGVGPEVLVGICVERSVEMVVAVLGVLKAGGGWLPLDPEYPRERLAFMLAEARVPVVLTQQRLLRILPENKAQVVCLDRDWPAVAAHDAGNPGNGLPSACVAYVIYTSGSTGRPKGVEISHRGLSNLAAAQVERFGLRPGDRVLQFFSLNFDGSVWEIAMALAAGAALHLAAQADLLPGPPLLEVLRRRRITCITIPPSALAGLGSEDPLPALATLIVAGEACSPELARQFSGGRRFINAYGPTETTVCATCGRHFGRERLSIGTPIANTRVGVFDRNLEMVPVGVAGELAIAGTGVARGYRDRPGLSADRFVPDPYGGDPAVGERLYRTGDLARRLSDGTIEFLGRIDHQVKVRGFRIELGEIEAVLGEHPAVRETVVLAREDVVQGLSLVAYVVWDADNPWLGAAEPGGRISELRRFLGEKVPGYMVPAAFVFLEALPLTPTGKIDRRALPAPERSRSQMAEALVAPRTPNEEILARIWSQVLNLERVGAHDNFFHLGGDSILGIQVAVRAREAGLEISPRDLFEHQTLAELAAVATTAPQAEADQGIVTGELPLTPIQHWFFERDLSKPHHFNQAVLLEWKQRPDPQLLERSLAALELHHDALRLRFQREEAEWGQRYATPGGAVPLIRVDLSALPAERQRAAVTEAAAELQASLDLAWGPLWRVAVLERGPARSDQLFWVVHHLAIDGVSWRVLLEDLERVYRQAERGETIALPPKTASYQSWAERLGEHARSEALRKETAHWLAEPRTRVRPLPEDVAGGVNIVASARTLSVALGVEETRSLLQEVPAAYHTRINDVLLTALLQAFEGWTGEKSLLVDLEGHGREELFAGVDLSRTVGWFTVICPVLLECGKSRGPGEDLMAVKERLRAVPNGGIGYGLLRYLSGDEDLARQLRGLPSAQVSFNYLGQLDVVFAESQLLRPVPESGAAPSDSGSMRSHLLHINGGVAEGRLSLDWIYSENVHHLTTIERLAEDYREALRALIRHCLSPEAGAYTPADFPEAKLGQKGLDKLFAQLKRKGEAGG